MSRSVSLPTIVSYDIFSSGSMKCSGLRLAPPGLSIVSVQFNIDGNAFAFGSLSTMTAGVYSTSLNTTSYPDGSTHMLTAVATDSNGNSTTSSAVMFTVNNSTPTGTPLVASFTNSTLRNDYRGFVGLQFKVGSAPITVYSLGRVFVNGNSGTHSVKLVKLPTGVDVVGGSANVTLSSSANEGGFVYAALTSPIPLDAGTSYILVSQETAGQDQWWDLTNVTYATNNSNGSAVSIAGGVYMDTAGYHLIGDGTQGQSYVPVNMKFTVNQ